LPQCDLPQSGHCAGAEQHQNMPQGRGMRGGRQDVPPGTAPEEPLDQFQQQRKQRGGNAGADSGERNGEPETPRPGVKQRRRNGIG
jgi:hypothetical protein